MVVRKKKSRFTSKILKCFSFRITLNYPSLYADMISSVIKLMTVTVVELKYKNRKD